MTRVVRGTLASVTSPATSFIISPIRRPNVLLKAMTASLLLHGVYAVKRGDTVLVHASAGGVSQILCRWAIVHGATVIGMTSIASEIDHAKRAGCARVIRYAQGDFGDAIMRLIDGRGADVVYDAAA